MNGTEKDSLFSVGFPPVCPHTHTPLSGPVTPFCVGRSDPSLAEGFRAGLMWPDLGLCGVSIKEVGAVCPASHVWLGQACLGQSADKGRADREGL